MGDNTWNLIESCWKFDPGERPTMEQIVCKLPAGIMNWLHPLSVQHVKPSYQNVPTQFLWVLYTARQGETIGNQGILEERSQLSEAGKGEPDEGSVDEKRRCFWNIDKDKHRERGQAMLLYWCNIPCD